MSSNAGEDEVNTAFGNGTALYGPLTWGTATLNDSHFTDLAEVWHTDIPPKGTTPGSAHRPLMGGHGIVIPPWTQDRDAAFEWVKWTASGDYTDPAIGEAIVKAGGQPARVPLLEKHKGRVHFFEGLGKCFPIAIPFLMLIPEGNAFAGMLGEETADAVNGDKSIEDALKAMDARARRLMEDGGYYSDSEGAKKT